MNFLDKLHNAIQKNNSLLCVGLDSDKNKIPKYFLNVINPLFEFNKAIVDATFDLVACYKINSAFYEAEGAKGIEQLKMTCDYIASLNKDISIILDAKRADIGNTNQGYTKFAFDYLNVDAITIHPYLGSEAIQPFLDQKDKGIIVLCRTSNPGAAEIQDLQVYSPTNRHPEVATTTIGSQKEKDSIASLQNDLEPLYRLVAKKVVSDWNKNNNCLLVIGATYPEEMKEIRELAPDMFFLVPGIGAQGGNVEQTLKAGLRKDNSGLIIHSSRAIIYASNSQDFAEKAQEEALKLRDEINKYRNNG